MQGSVYLLESTFDTHPWMFVAPNAPDVTRWLEVRELNQHVGRGGGAAAPRSRQPLPGHWK